MDYIRTLLQELVRHDRFLSVVTIQYIMYSSPENHLPIQVGLVDGFSVVTIQYIIYLSVLSGLFPQLNSDNIYIYIYIIRLVSVILPQK